MNHVDSASSLSEPQREQKHTPGPWSDPCTFGASKFEIHGERKQIAVVNRIEDARLIGAAPDLLEALKAMHDVLAPAEGDFTDEELAAMDKARAAIAKAEGR